MYEFPNLAIFESYNQENEIIWNSKHLFNFQCLHQLKFEIYSSAMHKLSSDLSPGSSAPAPKLSNSAVEGTSLDINML